LDRVGRAAVRRDLPLGLPARQPLAFRAGRLHSPQRRKLREFPMPTKIEKDALSGQDTTGHEWDGVKELNTPLPTWWVYTFYATLVFAVVYCALSPSWPWLNSHTQGLLGYSSRADLSHELEAQAKARSVFVDRVRATPLADLAKDPELFNFAMAGGR